LLHRFPSVTPHNPSHTFIIPSFIGVEGEHYGDHRQYSRVQHASLYAIHASENFLLSYHYSLAAAWLMSPLVISEKKKKDYTHTFFK
jgi:hypothetical protein